jgi:hypothetical protein
VAAHAYGKTDTRYNRQAIKREKEASLQSDSFSLVPRPSGVYPHAFASRLTIGKVHGDFETETHFRVIGFGPHNGLLLA